MYHAVMDARTYSAHNINFDLRMLQFLYIEIKQTVRDTYIGYTYLF